MKLLLFFLGIIFYFIFFLFSKNTDIEQGMIGNLFIEAHIYLVITIVCIISLFIPSRKKTFTSDDYLETNFDFSWEKILKNIKVFFQRYIYYFACFLFYLSLFGVFQVLLGKTDIPQIFLLFNILVLFLYFIEHKFSVFQDFLRVNTIVISLYYIFYHILYLFGVDIEFSFIDIINLGILAVLFYFFFRSDRGKKHIPVIASYTLIFIFLELSVVLKILFNYKNELMMVLSFLSSLSLLFFSDILKNKFYIPLTISRIWGLIFGFIFLIFLTLQIPENIIYTLIGSFGSLVIAFIFFIFHKRFQNYTALFFSSYAVSISLYIFYFFITPNPVENLYVFIFLYFISISFLCFDFFTHNTYIFDTYFFHIFSLLVNLTSIISFLFFIDFSILKGALFLLAESLYFFFSYFSLRKNLKKGYTTL